MELAVLKYQAIRKQTRKLNYSNKMKRIVKSINLSNAVRMVPSTHGRVLIGRCQFTGRVWYDVKEGDRKKNFWDSYYILSTQSNGALHARVFPLCSQSCLIESSIMVILELDNPLASSSFHGFPFLEKF